jgi:Tfp pilus assembly protein PilF
VEIEKSTLSPSSDKTPVGVRIGETRSACIEWQKKKARAMALDDKNPRVWASLGRQYLLAPKMFGGDVSKAVETVEKSVALDAQQDETHVWLAKAYRKHGDKAKAQEAIQPTDPP